MLKLLKNILKYFEDEDNDTLEYVYYDYCHTDEDEIIYEYNDYIE